jgi:hypothetical protein
MNPIFQFDSTNCADGVKVIHCKEQAEDAYVESLAGQLLGDDAYDLLVDEDADVYKPNGEILVRFRKGVIPVEMCEKTRPIWADAATPTDNRGYAAGIPEIGEDGKIKGLRKEHGKVLLPGNEGATRLKFLKQDGTVSKKTIAKTVNSGIVGFMEGNPRFPYCRLTAFNTEHMDRFNECMPMITLVDQKFSELMPVRHAAQMEYHNRTQEAFRIPGTSFTTITVNKTFRTAVHQDKGDLKEGFGVMTAIRSGKYKGGYLIFPKYRVAVNMCTTDLICADVHEWHCNSPITGIPGTYQRISLVFYYREKIAACGSPEEERRKAEAAQDRRLSPETQQELL